MNNAISPAPRSSYRIPNGFSIAGGSVVGSTLSLVPLVLAQAPSVGATELGMWLLAGAALTVMANQGFSFFKNLTGGFARKQTPRDEKTPSADDCLKKHLMVDAKFEAQRIEWENNRKDLHSRINAIAQGVARIEGKLSK